jgi:solute carrier family 25 (adenine nucleotide translocator) protein 4/5/6/31
VRGEKVGLFMVGVPPTIGDGPDDAASLVAGSTAAALCMTLASPIQRVKLLLQTQAEMVAAGRLLRPYAGMRDCFRRVVAEEGLLSLWRGNVAHLLRIVSANALGFVLKDRFKNVLHVDKVRGRWCVRLRICVRR